LIVDAIGDLIATAPRLISPPKRERIAQLFSACVDELGEGNIAAFARLLKQPRNTVWLWHSGQVLPSLDILLKICDCLEISVLDFLIQEVAVIAQGKIRNLPQIQPLGIPRKLPRSLDLNKIQQALKAVLESDEYPPPSMTKVAQRLEYDVRLLREHFSNLCHAISARYLREKKACYNRRVEQLCIEVQEVALNLNAQGVYPSNSRVSSYLKQPGCIRNKDVRAALYAVRRQLGWKS
jgi:transcriptional regulator with XRE-family HTH domain